MELSRDIFKDERIVRTYIQIVSGTLQKQPATDSKIAEQATAMSEHRDRQSDACNEHICEWAHNFLFHKYQPASEIIKISGSANRMAGSTFETTHKVDIDFRGRRSRIQHTDNNMCSLEVKKTENLEVCVWNNADRKQASQKRFNSDATEVRHEIQSSLSSRQEHKFDTKSTTVSIRKLCRDECVVLSSILKTQSTDQVSCNQHKNTRNDIILQELSPDYDAQDSLDALLKLLKQDHFFHDETNTNVFSDYEIGNFSKIYGITGAYPILSYNGLVFWIKDHDGVVYIWSRLENSMMLVGHDMRDALMNYLFRQENLHYINEYTHELITLDEAECEGKKWVESCEVETYVVTKESLKPLRGELKGSRKKKQKKKKNKNKK